MTLRLSEAASDGLRRAATRTGAILFGILFVLQLVIGASTNALVEAVAPPEATVDVGLALPVSGSVAGAILAVAYLCSVAYLVVVARALARPVSELSTFPSDLYTRRVGRATVSMFVAGIVTFVAVMIGLVLFVVPGVFLAICFLFFLFAIGVEDRGPIGGLRRSWALSKGNRLRLAAIVLLYAATGAAVGAVGTTLELAGAPAVGDVASALVSALVFVALYGITASAYLQLAGEDGFEPGAGAGTGIDSDAGPSTETL